MRKYARACVRVRECGVCVRVRALVRVLRMFVCVCVHACACMRVRASTHRVRARSLPACVGIVIHCHVFWCSAHAGGGVWLSFFVATSWKEGLPFLTPPVNELSQETLASQDQPAPKRSPLLWEFSKDDHAVRSSADD